MSKRIDLAAVHGGQRALRPSNRAQEQHRDWYRISNAGASSATVAIYDEIGYWGVTAAQFCDELRALEVDTLDVRINTPGGDVYDGVAIYNALIDHPADVTTTVDGMAASIGSIIAQAGDVRVMNRASEMMIHLPHAMCIGNTDDMEKAQAMLAKVGDSLAGVYADRAGGSPDMWMAAMRAETWYSAQEAVNAGLADAVQGKADDKAAASWNMKVFNYAGRANAPAPPSLANYNPDAIRRAVQEALR